MQRIFEKINELLREADIEGFIEIGAPHDEYESEAQQIACEVRKIVNTPTRQELRSIIMTIWKKNFNLDEEGLQLRSDAINSLLDQIYRID